MFPAVHGVVSQGGRGAAPTPGGDAYTYYRLLISANNGDQYTGIGELELYAEAEGASQSTNAGTATASSDDGVGGVAGNAFDGNSAADSPSWRSAPTPGFPQWLQKQFDTPFPLHHYAIVNWTTSTNAAARAPRSWQLQGSNDGETWETLDARTNRIGWTQAERREFDPSDPDVYYRLRVTANNGDTYLGIAEVELYETVGGAAVSSTDRLCVASGDDGSNLARHAFDGNSGTSWRVAFAGGPQWVRQIFPSSLVVVQYGVRNWHDSFNAATRAPRDWTFERSEDGENWTVLHTVTGETGWSAGELRKFTL